MALITAAHGGDPLAEETLVQRNLALVKSIVKKYLGRGVEYDDLFQLGCMGLVKAIQVKVSRSVKELAVRAVSVQERLRRTTGSEPGVQEIARELGVDAEEVALALDAGRPHLSLNESRFEDDDGERQDFLADTAAEGKMFDRLLLKELLVKLDARERQLIVMRYFKDRTQTQIAEVLGVSQVQVSRIERRALQELRAFMT